jgi:hypothetical protein
MATALEQLDAMRKLAENWDGYGAAAPRADLIDLAQEFTSLLLAARGANGAERTVHVSPIRTGGVLLEWEDRHRQHEIEISPDGSIGFLHVNKATQEMETRKFVPGSRSVLHPGLLQEIKQLVAA